MDPGWRAAHAVPQSNCCAQPLRADRAPSSRLRIECKKTLAVIRFARGKRRCGKALLQRNIARRSVLEATLFEDRHIDPHHSFDAPRNDLAFKSVKSPMVVARQFRERDSLRDFH